MTYEFKIILLGESGVGKTSLIHTYINGQFNSNRNVTKVVNLKSKELTLRGKRVKLSIWDTSSQKFFKNVVSNYYDGILLVYDITDMTTFNALSDWLKLLREKNDGATALVVGNKIDLPDSTAVSRDVALRFARDENLGFMESSAKNGDYVIDIFEHLALKILEAKNLVSNGEFLCEVSAPSSVDDTSYETSSAITFPDQSAESDTEKLQGSNLETRKLPLEPDVQISFNNANGHEATLKNLHQTNNHDASLTNLQQSRHEMALKNPQQTNNHDASLKNPQQTNKFEATLKNPQQANSYDATLENPQQSDLFRENANPSTSLLAGGDDDDEMEEIEQSFVFVSFLPPIVALPDDIPLLSVGRRRTSADSVLSLMTESEINSIRLRAGKHEPEASF